GRASASWQLTGHPAKKGRVFLSRPDRVNARESRRTPPLVRTRKANHERFGAPVLDSRQADSGFGRDRLVARHTRGDQSLVLFGFLTSHSRSLLCKRTHSGKTDRALVPSSLRWRSRLRASALARISCGASRLESICGKSEPHNTRSSPSKSITDPMVRSWGSATTQML